MQLLKKITFIVIIIIVAISVGVTSLLIIDYLEITYDVNNADNRSIKCYQPTSEQPHEDAAWNLDSCYWFVDDPYTPYEPVGDHLESNNRIKHNLPEKEPEPYPEPRSGPTPKSEAIREEEIRKDKARIKIQEIIMTDYRGNQHQIDAINEYRNEFESGYFLEQYILTFDQNYSKDELINFALVEWGYQETECTYPKVESYFMPYETKVVEKIGTWEKPKDQCASLKSVENGYLIMDVTSMPALAEIYQTCTIPGEYRISVTNLLDTPDVEWGYFTCQSDKRVGQPQPWMELP